LAGGGGCGWAWAEASGRANASTAKAINDVMNLCNKALPRLLPPDRPAFAEL